MRTKTKLLGLLEHKKLASFILILVLLISFTSNDSFLHSTLSVSQKPQSNSKPSQVGDCDWPMFGRTPEGNRVAPDGCGPQTDELSLRTKWSGPIGRPSTQFVIENDRFYFGSDNGFFYCCQFEPFKVFWEFETGALINSVPAISNGKVYFGSTDKKLYCLNVDNGQKVWEYETGAGIPSLPAISNGRVYFGSWDNKLYCLNAENGKKIWEYYLGGAFTPVISNGKVYCGSSDSKLYCLNAENGLKVWEYLTGGVCFSPKISNSKVFFCSDDKKLYCLNAENGQKIWEFETGGSYPFLSAITNGKVYCGSSDSKLYCLNAENGQIVWEFETGVGIESSPAISNGKVYCGSYLQKLYCLNAENGQKIWEFETGGSFPSLLAISNGRVYFESFDNKLYCLNAEKGQKLWEFYIGWSISTSPIISNGRIYIGSTFGKLYCTDYDTGDKIWEFQTGGNISSSPALFNDKVLCGSYDKKFYCLNADNGQKVWEFETGDTIYSSPTVSNSKVYFGSDDKKLYCLNVESGQKLWEYQTGGSIFSSPAISNGKVYVGSRDNKLYCLNAENGQKVWEHETGDKIRSSPAISNGKVYFGSDDKKLYCLNVESGQKLWEYQTGGSIFSSPAISNGKVYVGSRDNKLYCLNAENGQKVWDFNTDRVRFEKYPAIVNNKVFLGSDKFYCLNADNGQKVWEYKSTFPFFISPTIATGRVFAVSVDGTMYSFGDKNVSEAPFKLEATPYCGYNELRWEQANNAVSYLIFRKTKQENSFPDSPITNLPIKGLYFKDDINIVNGEEYCYYAAALNSNNEIFTKSNQACATPECETPVIPISFSQPEQVLNEKYTAWYKSQPNANKSLDFYDISFPLPNNPNVSEVQTSSSPGKPDLPCYSVKYKLSPDEEFVKVEREFVEKSVDVKGAVVPTSKQVPITVGGKPYVWPDEEYTSFATKNRTLCGPPTLTSINSPNPPVGVGGDPYKWPEEVYSKERNELTVYVNPAYFDHKNKKIVYYQDLKIKIKTKKKEGLFAKHGFTAAGFTRNDLLQYNNYNNNQILSVLGRWFDSYYDMCIISSAQFIGTENSQMDDFADYAVWKSKNGVKTKCYDIENIYASYPHLSDKTQRIKAFISDQKKANGIKYVLLGGDSELVPTKIIKANVDEYRAEIPSDAYYSSLSNEWDNQDIIDPKNTTVDVYVGRVPTSTNSELKTYINKIVTYQNTPFNEEYHRSILLLGEKLYDDSSIGIQAWGGDYLEHDTSTLPIDRPRVTMLYDNQPLYTQNNNPYKKLVIYNNSSDVVKTIEKTGHHIMLIDCHGHPACFGKSLICNNDIKSIQENTPGYITSSVSCNVNQFSECIVYKNSNGGTETYRYFDPNFIAKSMIFKEKGGALIFAGNSAYGWFDPTSYKNGISNKYQKSFLINTLRGGRIGEAFWEAKRESYLLNEKNGYDWWVYNSYNLLGDPSLKVVLEGKGIDKILILPEKAKVKIGEKITFEAKAFNKSGLEIKDVVFTWKVVPSDVGIIDNEGTFTALKQGTCFVTAYSEEKSAATSVVEVEGTTIWKKLELAPQNVLLSKGDSIQFITTAYDENGQKQNIKANWKVMPNELGIITDEGLFTAIGKEGQTGVVSASLGNVTATATVKIVSRDKVGPTITLVTPSQNNMMIPTGFMVLSLQVEDQSGLMEVLVNGMPATKINTNWIVNVNIVDGTNTFIIKAKDASENMNETTLMLTIFGTSPIILEMKIPTNTEASVKTVKITEYNQTKSINLKTSPETQNGSSFVGLRDLAENLFKAVPEKGGKIQYDASKKLITITVLRSNGDMIIFQSVIGMINYQLEIMHPDGSQEIVNGTLLRAPYIGSKTTRSRIENFGSTMVPMRSFVEALGGKVDYNSSSRIATFSFLK